MFAPPAANNPRSVPVVSTLQPSPGDFDVFKPDSVAPQAAPGDFASAFPLDSTTVSFGTPAGKAAATGLGSGAGASGALAVPSSDFDFGSPASASSAQRPSAIDANPFDAWGGEPAPAPAASQAPLNSTTPNSVIAPAVGSFGHIPLSQGVLGPQSHAARAAAISSLGGPPFPLMQQPALYAAPYPLFASSPHAFSDGAPAATPPVARSPLPAPPAFPLPKAAAADPFGFDPLPSNAPQEKRVASTPADPFGFPDVSPLKAEGPLVNAADPFAF